jgi:hypothetical protein
MADIIPVKTDETPVTTNADDDFAAAFEGLAKLSDGGDADATVADTAAAHPAGDDAAGDDADGEGAADAGGADDAAAGADGAADATAKPAAGNEPVTSTTPPPSRLSDEELVDRLAKAVKPEPAPAPIAQPDLYSAEEKEALTAYEKDWPEIARAEALRRRAEYREMLAYVFNEVAKVTTPLEQAIAAVSTSTYERDIYDLVPDYDEYRDATIAWAQDKSQPAYLQAAFNHVIKEGTVEEVADLIGRYKQAKGITAPAAPAQPAKQDTELPAAAKQAAASLAPVRSKRSSVISSGSPSDFDGAFAEFAKDL